MRNTFCTIHTTLILEQLLSKIFNIFNTLEQAASAWIIPLAYAPKEDDFCCQVRSSMAHQGQLPPCLALPADLPWFSSRCK